MTRTRTRLCLATSVITTLVATSFSALAADYYFDSSGGNDSNDGKTEATAKKTFKMPSETGSTVYLKRGSSWTMNLSVRNATVKAYGDGEARPAIIGTIQVMNSTVEGIAAKPPAGGTGNAVNCINVMGGSTLKDCEADGGGSADYKINVGIGVMGANNRILNNYVHDLAWSQSGGQMDNSGGAEGIMVMASNNEIAFNSVVRASSKNSTLGGFEGGCFEIVNGKAGSTISNVSFHHNFCDQSIGMWEGCSGDFSATGGGIQENHGIIENVTVSYNLALDSMWLFLLQPVNTDFRNVVFANNAIIHTAKSEQYWDKSSFHYSIANAVATYTNSASGTSYDTDNEYYKKGKGFQPGTIIVKNNLFIDQAGSKRYTMFLTNLTDHSNNIFVPKDAALGSITLDATEKKLDLVDLALDDNWRITAQSTPLIDQGILVNMSTNGSLAKSALDPSFFEKVFVQDIDEKTVPCGSAPDIGPSEYCSGSEGGTPNAKGGATGAGGSPGSGGLSGSRANAGGKSGVGTLAKGGATGGSAKGSANANSSGSDGTTNASSNGNSSNGNTNGSGGGTATNNGKPEGSSTTALASGGGSVAASSAAQSSTAPGDTTASSSGNTNEQGKGKGGSANASGDVDGDKGCACRSAGAGTRSSGIGLAILLGLGMAKRRRRSLRQ